MKRNKSCSLDLGNKKEESKITLPYPSIISTHSQEDESLTVGLEVVGLGDNHSEPSRASVLMGHGISPMRRLSQPDVAHKSAHLCLPQGCYIRMRDLILIN